MMTKFKVVAGTDLNGRKPEAKKAAKPVRDRGWIDGETIKRLRADPRSECRVPDGDKSAEGFGVRKRTNLDGSVSLFFNFAARMGDGKTLNHALGTVGVQSVEEAREKARKLRKWIDRGLDPRVMLAEETAAMRAREAEEQEAEAMTLGHAIRLKLESTDLREGTKKQYRSLLSTKSKVNLRHLQNKRLDAISKTDWRAILKKVRNAYGPKSPQPAVMRRTIAALYRNAIAESDFLKLDNPITELRRAEFADPKARRSDRLDTDGIFVWFRALNHHHSTIANLAKLYLLTGMRDREARLLTWDEIEADAIRLPPHRVKTERELLIPRTPAIDVILAAQARFHDRSPYVFPAVLPRPLESREGQLQRPVSSILPVLKKLGCSVHGMRRTAATFMDQCGVPENIRRHILNHTPDISRGYVIRDLQVMRQWLFKYHSWIKDQIAADESMFNLGELELSDEEGREWLADTEHEQRKTDREWTQALKLAPP